MWTTLIRATPTIHTLTLGHTNTPPTFLQEEKNGKVILRLKSWHHDSAVQFCPTFHCLWFPSHTLACDRWRALKSCRWNISSLFSPLLAGKKKEEVSRGLGFCQYSEQLSGLAWCHMGGIRRRRVPFPYPAWPLCTYSKELWRAAMSFPIPSLMSYSVFLFYCLLLPFFVFISSSPWFKCDLKWVLLCCWDLKNN